MSFESLLSQLPQAVATDVASAFTALVSANPQETFYGLATCHEPDSYSCYVAANSKEAIQRELEERSLRSGVPIAELSFELVDVPNWPFESKLPIAKDVHSKIWAAFEDEGLDYSADRRRVYDAYVEGLQLFEAQGGLSGCDRESFFLIPWVHDPGDEPAWVMQAVKSLNPQSVWDHFSTRYSYRSG